MFLSSISLIGATRAMSSPRRFLRLRACTLLFAASCAQANGSFAEADRAFVPGEFTDPRGVLRTFETQQLPLGPCAEPIFGDRQAQCGSVLHPFRWRQRTGRWMRIGFQRLVALRQPARAHLWILTGGPGGSSNQIAPESRTLAVPEDVDIWTVDARGVGASSRLSCARAESPASPASEQISMEELDSCLEEMRERYAEEDFGAFSTTESAIDLGVMMERARVTTAPEAQILVEGQSYGTFLAQRFSAIFPNRAHAIVVAGVLPDNPESSRLLPRRAFEDFNARVVRMLERCGADTRCRALFARDPVSAVRDGLRRIDAGACPVAARAGWDGPVARAVLGALSANVRNAPAFVEVSGILASCADTETHRQRLNRFFAGAPVEFLQSVSASNTAFQWLIVRNELMNDDAAWEGLSGGLSSLIGWYLVGFIPGLSPAARLETYRDVMPRYPADAYVGRNPWAQPESAADRTRLLVLQGDVDAQTPVERVRPIVARWSGTRRIYVEFPNGGHDVAQEPCARRITEEFLAGAVPDTSCAASAVPLRFFE